MALDLKQMERDILEAAYTLGRIGSITNPETPASEFLYKRYPSEEAFQQVVVLVRHLLEERFLFPAYIVTKSQFSNSSVSGITPKGLKRLRELKAPRWTWFKTNWFPTLVAAITAIAAVGSIVVDATCNRG